MTYTYWPFNDLPQLATLTLRRILNGTEPIRYVTHDADDGMWQFLDGNDVTEDEAIIVALHEILLLDPTVASLSDLPLGWYAIRSAPHEPWQRGQRGSV